MKYIGEKTMPLIQSFGRKLARELCEYKRWMKKQSKEYIFDHAFEIDSMICIYENLMEMSRTMDAVQLKKGIRMPDLLRCCYEDWAKKEDDVTKELMESIYETIHHFHQGEETERMDVFEKASG